MALFSLSATAVVPFQHGDGVKRIATYEDTFGTRIEPIDRATRALTSKNSVKTVTKGV